VPLASVPAEKMACCPGVHAVVAMPPDAEVVQ